MRFSSFLPMLLLVGSLYAQNQCSIYDLTAAATTTNATSPCQYYVTLKFKYTGTTNQFTVKGNGVDYGTFTYDQVPLTLGPFTAGATPTVKEFVVTDAVYADCQDETEVQIPACPQNTACDIYDVKVETGSCNLGSLTYSLTLKFQVKNPGNDFFEAWAGNGQYLGIFPLNQLPVTIPNFPWDGDPIDYLKICINDHPDCCETVEFPAPDCIQGPCNISDLQVVTGNCTSDSTYQLKLNFAVTNASLISQFAVWANNELLGFFGPDDLPIAIDSFPWDGGPVDFIKVCAIGLNVPPGTQYLCCKTAEFQVPECLPVYPCGIKDLKVETDSCSSDSTFGIWLNFAVNDTSAVDSFQLWGNGHFIGTFSLDSLPLHLDDFPWNGGIFSYVRVCTGNTPACCKEFQFLAPACLPFGPCEVKDIFIQTGACTSDSTYKIRLNFQATNPGDGTFTVWANSELIDTFPLTAVPLALDSFPWGGGNVDVVKICINGSSDSTNNAGCCREEEFHAPDCLFPPDSCDIRNVVVDPGDCSDNGLTYSVLLDFDVSHPGNDYFELWAGNGTYLGHFPLSALPLKIPEFPCTSSGTGVLKICINDNPNCCTIVEFQAPTCCGANNPCEITNLTVETGDCTGNETYEVWINFDVVNPLGDQFGVWANGGFLGTFPLDSLPLYIHDFPWNGGVNDVVKICFTNNNGAVGCCKTLEFPVPDCLDQPCEIYNLSVGTGDCTGDSTYQVKLNFQVANPPGNTFGIWANGEFLGTFNLNQLPMIIQDFPWNGGSNDVIKICFVNPDDPAGSATCCRTKEFPVPDCLVPAPCEIYDLVVDTGDCTGDSTYAVTINFQVANPPGNTFGVWANGEFLGNFSLDSLPLHIHDFPWNGGQNDVVKICFVNSGAVGCCRIKEFAVPDCLEPGGPCEIYDLKVETGDCTSDSTYQAWINFQVANPPGNTFVLWINGVLYDSYNLDSLPIYLPDFPWGGGQLDVVKVCFTNDPSNSGVCCRSTEFHVPDCLQPGGPCEIYNLKVETGDCTSDSTYGVWIKFDVANPPADQFGVWANGEFLGLFDLDSLPLYIPDFPWGGGANDVVKVCFPITNNTAACCRTKEFAVPDCLDQNCKIYDLKVVKTPCLCGQFFALVSFKYQNGGSGGVDIAGNGTNYGNFPYNYPQPVILGPLDGDGTTAYEFVVKDHLHPDCADDFLLGKVNCQTPAPEAPGGSKLALSPNPTSGWLNVTAQLPGGVLVGEADVEIYHADGRLVRTLTVANGSNFQLDVTDLQAGVYRLSLLAAAGRVEGTFAKQ